MRYVRIGGGRGGLVANISPDYGGMPVFLGMSGGVNILRLEEGLLGAAPMLAGGMPFLFPFASRTRDDRYLVDGRTYHMPFHGLVKNAAFAVREMTDGAATVWIGSNPAQESQYYPFRFRLELSYAVRGMTFEAEAAVVNLSGSRMPHSLGWHPFFLSSAKETLSFRHHMRRRYDYIACVDEDAPAEMDLSRLWDDVFIDPAEREFTLENPTDGYAVRCRFDDGHHALVVCTTTDRSVCVEPWCGIPDSINNGRFLQWIEPGETGRYKICLDVSGL